MNALQRGSVVATALTPPLTALRGNWVFASSSTCVRRISNMPFIDRRYDRLYGKPSAVDRELLKGYMGSLHFFAPRKNRRRHHEVHEDDDRSRAEEGYEYYLDLMPVLPYARVAGVKAVLQFLAPPSLKPRRQIRRILRHSVLKKMEDSGFAEPFAIRR